MKKFKRPLGLIRYDTGHNLHGSKDSLRPQRPRLYIYPAMLVVLVGVLFIFASNSEAADVTLLRGIGAPFTIQGDTVQNQIRIKIQNRASSETDYFIRLKNAPGIQLIAPINPLSIAAGQRGSTSVFVLVPDGTFVRGQRKVELVIEQKGKPALELPYTLLGPRSGAGS